MLLTIVCHREGGMIRGGVRHGRVAEHMVTRFTPDQLRELIAEPNITVVVGRPLTSVDIAQIEEARAAEAKAATRERNTPPGKEGEQAAGVAEGNGAPAAAKKTR